MNSKLVILKFFEKDEIQGLTKIQKLFFLMQEHIGKHMYVFRKGKYGPFSEELYDDIRKLEGSGFIVKNFKEQDIEVGGLKVTDNVEVYELTEKGKASLENEEQIDRILEEKIDELVSEYKNKSIIRILKDVQREYSEYFDEI